MHQISSLQVTYLSIRIIELIIKEKGQKFTLYSWTKVSYTNRRVIQGDYKGNVDIIDGANLFREDCREDKKMLTETQIFTSWKLSMEGITSIPRWSKPNIGTWLGFSRDYNHNISILSIKQKFRAILFIITEIYRRRKEHRKHRHSQS